MPHSCRPTNHRWSRKSRGMHVQRNHPTSLPTNRSCRPTNRSCHPRNRGSYARRSDGPKIDGTDHRGSPRNRDCPTNRGYPTIHGCRTTRRIHHSNHHSNRATILRSPNCQHIKSWQSRPPQSAPNSHTSVVSSENSPLKLRIHGSVDNHVASDLDPAVASKSSSSITTVACVSRRMENLTRFRGMDRSALIFGVARFVRPATYARRRSN